MTPSAQMPAAASHGGSFAGKAAWSGLSVVILAAGRFGAGIIAARTLGPAISGEVIYLLLLAYSLSQAANTFVTSHLAGRQRFDLMARLSAVSGVLLTIGVAMGCLFGGLSGAILGYALGALPGVFFVRRMLRTGGAGACALDTAVRARAMQI